MLSDWKGLVFVALKSILLPRHNQVTSLKRVSSMIRFKLVYFCTLEHANAYMTLAVLESLEIVTHTYMAVAHWHRCSHRLWSN